MTILHSVDEVVAPKKSTSGTTPVEIPRKVLQPAKIPRKVLQPAVPTPVVSYTGPTGGTDSGVPAPRDPSETMVSQSAEGGAVPIIYGRVRVPGLPFVLGSAAGGVLVVGYIFCSGPVDAVESYTISGQAAPDGVTVQVFTGTTVQGVSSILASIVGVTYVETHPGLCYMAISITPAAQIWGAIPDVQAIIRGRKDIADPRATPPMTTGYTANPALCLAHLLTALDLGGMSSALVDWASVTTAANWCDVSIGGTARRSIGAYIATRQTVQTAIQSLLSQVGLWDRSSCGVWKLGFDDDTAASVATLDEDYYLVAGDGAALAAKESLSQRDSRATVVRAGYPEPLRNWENCEQVVYASGVRAGTIPWRESSISLPAITSAAVARRIVEDRLNEGLAARRLIVTCNRKALALERGDVVTTKNVGAKGLDLEVEDHFEGTFSSPYYLSPVWPLGPVGVAASSSAKWQTCGLTFTVEASLDGGSTWAAVEASGNAIPGLPIGSSLEGLLLQLRVWPLSAALSSPLKVEILTAGETWRVLSVAPTADGPVDVTLAERYALSTATATVPTTPGHGTGGGDTVPAVDTKVTPTVPTVIDVPPRVGSVSATAVQETVDNAQVWKIIVNWTASPSSYVSGYEVSCDAGGSVVVIGQYAKGSTGCEFVSNKIGLLHTITVIAFTYAGISGAGRSATCTPGAGGVVVTLMAGGVAVYKAPIPYADSSDAFSSAEFGFALSVTHQDLVKTVEIYVGTTLIGHVTPGTGSFSIANGRLWNSSYGISGNFLSAITYGDPVTARAVLMDGTTAAGSCSAGGTEVDYNPLVAAFCRDGTLSVGDLVTAKGARKIGGAVGASPANGAIPTYSGGWYFIRMQVGRVSFGVNDIVKNWQHNMNAYGYVLLGPRGGDSGSGGMYGYYAGDVDANSVAIHREGTGNATDCDILGIF